MHFCSGWIHRFILSKIIFKKNKCLLLIKYNQFKTWIQIVGTLYLS